MKLEIGSGNNPTEGYIHLDINPKSKDVDIVGDIRSLISNDYNIEEYPDLKSIKSEFFEEIKAQHFIEHVQWIYQESLFYLLYEWLEFNGRLEIETPDLEWIVKSYLYNKKTSFLKKKRYEFPSSEHSTLTDSGDKNQFYKWVNFKIFSGCSPGDFHHCLYDKESLRDILNLSGFDRISIRSKYATLICSAIKSKSEKERDYYST